jgi:hypothetical protein
MGKRRRLVNFVSVEMVRRMKPEAVFLMVDLSQMKSSDKSISRIINASP